MASIPHIDALFLALFDDKKGQSLIWNRRINDEINLDGIEFQALPSGLHLVPSDTFYFSRKGKQRESTAIVVFENTKLTSEQIVEAGEETGGRGRLMFSLGMLMSPDSSNHFPPLTELKSLLHRISGGWTKQEPHEAFLDRVLEPFWEFHKQSGSVDAVENDESLVENLGIKHGISSDHPLHYLPAFARLLGPIICTLWKYAITGRRILFYSQPELELVSKAAWCTWAMGLAAESTFLGSIGLMEMTEVEKRSGGWVAFTSDAIFRDRPKMWDLFIDLSASPLSQHTGTPSLKARYTPDGPKSLDISTRPITYTFSDTSLWSECQQALADHGEGEFEDMAGEGEQQSASVWSYAYGAYSKICDVCWGLCAFATGFGLLTVGAGEHNHSGGGYIRLPAEGVPNEDPEDEEEDAGLFASRGAEQGSVGEALAILEVLEKRSKHLKARVDKFSKAERKSISKDEMQRLGLSAWSWVDVDFVKALYSQSQKRREEWGEEIEVEKGWFRRVSGMVGL